MLADQFAETPAVLRDRADAGRYLAQRLRAYQDKERCGVVALPRGGVVVGAEIARALHLPMDVLIVRKLGVPWQPELAMGAIASGGVRILHEALIRDCGVRPEDIDRVAAAEQIELQRRERLYHEERPPHDYRGWTAIVVDDGIATGATLEAALRTLRMRGAQRVVVAVGVAQRDSISHFQQLADEVVSILAPRSLVAISCWYEQFPQTTDEEVKQLLHEAALAAAARPGERKP